MNGLLSKTFHTFSLTERVWQCLPIAFLMLGNVLFKVSTNGKFQIASPYFLTVFFDLHSWLFQGDGPEL